MNKSSKKRVALLLAKDPNYFSNLAKKRKKPFHYFTYLKQSDPERLRKISKTGGQS